jgi:trehalose 6-phosphate synthase/phosphatase
MQGSKVIEVKQSNVNKGRAAQRWLSASDPAFDFILAVGDDVTDEDLFQALPDQGYSIKVGPSNQTSARFYLQNAAGVRQLLKDLVESSTSPQQ